MMEGVRERIVRVAVAAVAIALLLFAVPLAVIVRSALFDDETRELEAAALQGAVRIDPDFSRDEPVELPHNSDQQVGAYDVSSRLRFGRGPATGDTIVRQAAAGSVAEGQAGGELIVAVPVTSQEKVVGVVRAAQPVQVIWTPGSARLARTYRFGGRRVRCGRARARRQARHLSAPLETLARTSEQIAAGDLTVRAEPSGILEIGRVAETHNAMVDKLDDMLERERHFTANASHQLRTPLTGLQLGLRLPKNKLHETPASTCDQRCRRQTIRPRSCIARSTTCFRSPAFLLTSGQRPTRFRLTTFLVETERRWHGPLATQGRRLSLRRPQDMAIAKVPGRVVGQVLDILLDNASGHGLGAVTVTARDIGDRRCHRRGR